MATKSKPSDASAEETTTPASFGKRIIIAATEQGSVGKSFFFVNLAHYLSILPNAPRVSLYETDEKPTLRTFYKEATQIDLNVPRQLDSIVLGLKDSDISLVDGAAGRFQHSFVSWGKDVLFFEACRELGASITFVVPVDDTLKYIQAAGKLLDGIPADVQLLVVVNHHKQRIDLQKPIEDWDQSASRKLFLDRGAKEIHLARLDGDSRELVEKQCIPAGAMAHSNPLRLNLLDHNRFKLFTRNLYSQLDSVQDLLLPPLVS